MIMAIFGLIGVVVGSLLTLAREWWFQGRKNKKDREYLVVIVSCALDTYARQCSDVVADDGLYHGQTDEHGYHRVQTDTPEFKPETMSVEWKSLPASLLYQIVSLPAQADLANRKVSGVFEHCATLPESAEGFEERQFQYARLGLKAAVLAEQLRKLEGLDAVVKSDWDPVKYMEEELNKIEIQREEYARLHTSRFAGIPVGSVASTV